jgi:hypothetical protein
MINLCVQALASQGNFSETGQEKDLSISRVITKKSTAYDETHRSASGGYASLISS